MTNHDFRIADEERVSDAVVRTVATVEGVAPADLGEKLYDAIDPDALDRLFNGNRSAVGSIRFSFCDHDVSVHTDGRLVVLEE